MMGRNRASLYDEDEEDEDEDDFWDGRGKRRRASPGSSFANDTQTSTEAQDNEKQRTRKPAPRKAPEPGEILTVLREADLLPCLYFLPGRRVVEEAAMSAALHLFTTPEEERQIREEVSVWLEHLPKEDRNLRQVHLLVDLLPRGLAFHHAGLLP